MRLFAAAEDAARRVLSVTSDDVCVCAHSLRFIRIIDVCARVCLLL